jgi:hypothetical protein
LVGIVAQEVRAVKRDFGVEVLAASIFSLRETAPEAPGCDCEDGCGKPNPEEFALKNFKTAMCKESSHPDRRHVNRPPREEVTLIVEGSEEGDSQATVGHGVQETVAGSRQKEIRPQRDQAKPGEAPSKSYK